MNKKVLVSVSGGLGSAYALKMCLDLYGRENVTAIFADVKGTGYSHEFSPFPDLEYLTHERFGGESRDTYRFIWQISHALDIPIIRLENGRSIWSIFAKTRSFRLHVGKRFLCKASELLKRQVIADWIKAQPDKFTHMAVGMGFWEKHRIYNAQKYWDSVLGEGSIEVFSPFAEKTFDNCVFSDWLNQIGVDAPGAYAKNYKHNNCNGTCVMAGQSQWSNLYKTDRETFLYAAYQEASIRRNVGLDATILKITRNGEGKPVTLLEFADMVEAGDVNEMDLGGSCSCFTTSPAMVKFLAEAQAQEALG